MKHPTILLLIALGPASACRDDPSPGTEGATEGATDGTDTGADTGGAASVTFWDDVAPIYFDNCVTCHRDGGIAPFRLDVYDDASTWASASAAAVAARTMPPWLVDDDGTCGSFLDSRALPQDDIDTITAWQAAGMPQGEVRNDLVAPTSDGLEHAQTFTTPEFTPEIVGGPLAEFDEYRCFMFDPGLDGDRFVTGYEVVPGNDAIIHHVLVFTVDPDEETMPGVTNAQAMQALDDESPDRAGWPCFEGAGETVSESALPVAWAPGQGVVRFPEQTGMWIGDNEVFVAQVHYNLADPGSVGQSDQTEIHLQLAEQVERPGFMVLPDLFLETLFDDEPAALAPGEASVEYSWDLPAAAFLEDQGLDSIELYGVLPHMHQHGRRIDLTIEGEQAQTCAARVPRWDFDWQFVYFYDEPLTVTPADVLHVRCDYDTQDTTEPVLPGWGTHNEMCLMGLFLVP